MPRKRLVAVIALAGALGVTSPAALAGNAHKRQRHERHQTTIVLTVSKRGAAFSAGPVHPLLAAVTPTSLVSYTGFRCEATVGIGTHDQLAHNYFVNDSAEFYSPYTQGSAGFDSVTINCVGKLPPGTLHSRLIVSHPLACREFNPFTQSAPTIQGFGMSTTYPDGMYSETCNRPNFQ